MKHRILGIDENGLGPLLGPMVVTGTLLESDTHSDLWFGDISDSKMFFKTRSMNNFALVEETAISIFYLLKKKMPSSPLEILRAFCSNNGCTAGNDICTGRIPREFTWADSEKAKKRCFEFSQWASHNNVGIKNVSCVFICPRKLNSFTRNNTKLFLDFLSFCSLIKEVNGKDKLEVEAGKIGGLKFYMPYIRYSMDDFQSEIVTEKESESIYILNRQESSMRVGFFMDVEKKSFPAALSSIAGKYIREISMLSIRKSLNIEGDISGYHDRKTLRQIKGLKLHDIPEECVFRLK